MFEAEDVSTLLLSTSLPKLHASLCTIAPVHNRAREEWQSQDPHRSWRDNEVSSNPPQIIPPNPNPKDGADGLSPSPKPGTDDEGYRAEGERGDGGTEEDNGGSTGSSSSGSGEGALAQGALERAYRRGLFSSAMGWLDFGR